MTRLLIVDDDKALCEALSAAFRRRGYEVRTAHDAREAVRIAGEFKPERTLTDLKMPGASGLELIPQLLEIDSGMRVVALTGYASIATAVEAIKLGAIHYLAKPVSPDEIVAAFHKGEGDPDVPVEAEARTLFAAEREHILAVFLRTGRNVSATARELGMHRRTLQRKLDKMRA
jgi:two-component system response regulator RegA